MENNTPKSQCCNRPLAKSVSTRKGTRLVCTGCGNPEPLKLKPISHTQENKEGWERNAEKINDSLWYVNPQDVRKAISLSYQEGLNRALKALPEVKQQPNTPQGIDYELAQFHYKNEAVAVLTALKDELV